MSAVKAIWAWLMRMPAGRRRVLLLVAVILLGSIYSAYRIINYDPNYIINVVHPDQLVLKTETMMRIIGVECPPVQDDAVGKPAAEFVRSCVLKRAIRVEPGEEPKDAADWRLGYIFYTRDGKERFLNEDLLRMGYGRHKPVYPNLKYRKRFEAAEAEARQKKLGVWAPGYKFPGD